MNLRTSKSPSRLVQYSVNGAILMGILLFPLIALLAIGLILDTLQFKPGKSPLLLFGIILLTLVVGFKFVRASFRTKGVAQWLAWIALLGGHLAVVNIAYLGQNVSLNTAISSNSCRQVIAAIRQFCLEQPRREWIYHDDIVGRYISLIVHSHADDPTENFPFHWDEQEYVVTMNNGYKVIMWSDVPLRELGDVYTFAQKPNGKLYRGSISGDDKEAWPDYLEWKRNHTHLKSPVGE